MIKRAPGACGLLALDGLVVRGLKAQLNPQEPTFLRINKEPLIRSPKKVGYSGLTQGGSEGLGFIVQGSGARLSGAETMEVGIRIYGPLA